MLNRLFHSALSRPLPRSGLHTISRVHAFPATSKSSAGLSLFNRQQRYRGYSNNSSNSEHAKTSADPIASPNAPASKSSSWLSNILMAIGAGVLLNATSDYWMEKAEACGIVAFVGKEPAVDYLIEGLQILQSRGYDSAGVTTINSKGELVTTKYASKGSTSDSIAIVVKEAPERHKGDMAGISHTRWATHGGKTDQNAHPHLDYKNRVALVHNGTIENSSELKEELTKKGIPFRSETDTEVIVQLIGSYLDEKLPLVDAVKKAIGRLEGTWGLVILSKDHPDQLIAARHGSPLVIGVGKERMFVASEVSAFSRHVHEFVALKDGEVAVVTREGKGLDLSRVEQAHVEKIELSPHPYPHWTIKEIMEQPEAVARTLNYGGRFGADGTVRLGGLDMNRDMLLGIRHLILGACGTSLYASTYGQLLFQKLKCFDTVQAVDASELFVDGFPPKEGGLLVVSQSGETKDVHRTLEIASSVGVPQFSVVNTVGSLIARTTRCGVYLNAGRENAVASTKAFTTQVTALALVAGWYSQNRFPGKSQDREELMDAIHRLPTYIGISLQTRDKCAEVAKKLKSVKNMFILGKGYARPIAMEGALKIKEITYVHAEGYGGGALKHGPFALLDNQTPVVLIILDDQHAELMKIAAAQIKARGSYTIVITDKPSLAKGISDDVITIPNNGPLTALLATIPLQLIAYEMSVSKGIDPDKPRHLAKAVTVD